MERIPHVRLKGQDWSLITDLEGAKRDPIWWHVPRYSKYGQYPASASPGLKDGISPSVEVPFKFLSQPPRRIHPSPH